MTTSINDPTTLVDTATTAATGSLSPIMDTTSTMLTTIVTSLASSEDTPSSIAGSFNTSPSSFAPGDLSALTTNFTPVVILFDNVNTCALSSTTYNYTEVEIKAYLEELQSQTTNIMIPAMVYLVLLAVVGSIGNSLVLFVYSHKFTRTATRIFILVIASFDIITNVIVIPGEIYDMFHIWDFNQPSFCKIRLFFNAFTTMASAMVLVAVAVARYRKICKPFGKQVTITQAKIISTTMTLGCLTFSIPWAIINGRQTKQTPRPGICGYECTLDDSYQNTIWPLLNTLFFILLFLVCCGTIVVLYAFIGIQAWRHSHVYGVAASKKPSQSFSGTNDSTDSTEMTSRSAEISLVGILSKSARSRSYIKKKSGDPESMENVIKSGVGCVSDSKPHNDSTKNTANDNVIELVDDNTEDNKAAYHARMIRAPTGEKVNINLSMVRELTVKLRAVQKETEQQDAADDLENDQESRPVKSVVTFKRVSSEDESCSGDENDPGRKARNKKKIKMKCKSERREVVESGSHKSDDDQSGERCTSKNGSTDSVDTAAGKGRKCKSKNGSTDNIDTAGDKGVKCKSKNGPMVNMDTPIEKGGKCKSKSGSTDSINVDDGKCKSKNCSTESIHKNCSNELKPQSSHCPSDTINDIDSSKEHSERTIQDNGAVRHEDVPDNNELDDEAPNDEPLTDFAKAMLWVDITYCLNNETSGAGGNDEPEEENNGGAANGLTKKSSFTSSRKISRDNSFLRKHRKLRDALTDTLTRARKSKKEKSSEAKAGDSVTGVNERISENVNDDADEDMADKNHADEAAEVQVIKQESFGTVEKNRGSVKEKPQVSRRGMGRTTAMLLIISVVYIVGFLPFLALSFYKHYALESFSGLDVVGLTFYNLFLRSYFLNSAANPIVYSLCDINFRRECLKVLKLG